MRADTKPTLTITASSETITWGDAIPELSLSYEGFIDADEDGEVDDENYLDMLIVARTDATAESPAGTYTTWPGLPPEPGDFNPSEDITDSTYELVLVNGTLTILKADQAIEEVEPFFSSPFTTRTYAESDFSLSAITTSGLPASYEASGACSVSGDHVHLIGNGACTLTVTQEGNENWNAAEPVTYTFDITGAPEESRSSGGSRRRGSGGYVRVPEEGRVLGASLYFFAHDLTLGSTGEDVTELQKVLVAGGFLKIEAPTGYFGPMTQAAVTLYQVAHGITPASGYVGPRTRAALNAGTTSTTTTVEQQIADLMEKVKTLQAQLASSL